VHDEDIPGINPLIVSTKKHTDQFGQEFHSGKVKVFLQKPNTGCEKLVETMLIKERIRFHIMLSVKTGISNMGYYQDEEYTYKEYYFIWNVTADHIIDDIPDTREGPFDPENPVYWPAVVDCILDDETYQDWQDDIADYYAVTGGWENLTKTNGGLKTEDEPMAWEYSDPGNPSQWFPYSPNPIDPPRVYSRNDPYESPAAETIFICEAGGGGVGYTSAYSVDWGETWTEGLASRGWKDWYTQRFWWWPVLRNTSYYQKESHSRKNATITPTSGCETGARVGNIHEQWFQEETRNWSHNNTTPTAGFYPDYWEQCGFQQPIYGQYPLAVLYFHDDGNEAKWNGLELIYNSVHSNFNSYEKDYFSIAMKRNSQDTAWIYDWGSQIEKEDKEITKTLKTFSGIFKVSEDFSYELNQHWEYGPGIAPGGTMNKSSEGLLIACFNHPFAGFYFPTPWPDNQLFLLICTEFRQKVYKEYSYDGDIDDYKNPTDPASNISGTVYTGTEELECRAFFATAPYNHPKFTTDLNFRGESNVPGLSAFLSDFVYQGYKNKHWKLGGDSYTDPYMPTTVKIGSTVAAKAKWVGG
jgi:hypothetical protein